MESKRFFKNTAFALLIVGLFTSGSFAGLVDSGSVDIVGDVSAPQGSFTVQVDYWLYNGAGTDDPLGQNGYYQATFQLTHNGGTGEEPIPGVRTFTVFTELSGSASTPHYDYDCVSAGVVNQDPDIGGEAPLAGVKWDDKVEFWFTTTPSSGVSTFFEGDISQLLVVNFNSSSMPLENLLLEIDGDENGINGDVRIDMIPEPATLLLLGSGSVLLLRARKRRSA